MTSFSKKIVTFDECITIRYYEYDIIEDCEEKNGKDWQRTSDLICREFIPRRIGFLFLLGAEFKKDVDGDRICQLDDESV